MTEEIFGNTQGDKQKKEKPVGPLVNSAEETTDSSKILKNYYHLSIKEMPDDDRPREKMLAYGPEVLSNAELIAAIIGSGVTFGKQGGGLSAVELGREILRAYDNDLKTLYEVGVSELFRNEKLRGIGPAKACQIKAALELGHRIKYGKRDLTQIRTPQDVYNYLFEEMQGMQQEHFVVLLLNVKNKVFRKEVVTVGTINASLVHPREVFSRAIRQNAASIIVVHNHPSGDIRPSDEDREVTKRLVSAGNILGIPVQDHIIIGDDYFSFKEEGDLM